MYGLTKPASSRLTVMLYSPRFAHAGDEQSEYERVVTVLPMGTHTLMYCPALNGARAEPSSVLRTIVFASAPF